MAACKGKHIVVVKHTYYDSSGTPDAELVRYLRGKASSILDILHPFPDAATISLNTTVVEYGPDGEVLNKTTAPLIRGNQVLFYCKDFLFSVYYVLKSRSVYDLYIGADNLNTFAGLFLRILGRVRRVAYYVIDFTPVRFHNKVLNTIYQAINKVCCYHADVIWNVSESMIEGREHTGIRKDLSAPQITVPLGCAFEDIPRRNVTDVNPYDIVYFGSLRDEHGPELILEALPEIIENVPEVRVIFAGDGVLREQLVNRANELGISSHVSFTGFVESGEEVYGILTRAGLALATYPPGNHTYKSYSDPGKVKMYLACGLPVLITDVPPIARIIQERKAGVIVEYNPSNLAQAVITIINDSERFRLMREQAIALAAEFDWNTIWDRTFESMDF